ncbi:MAG TPA: hypothetical protein VMW80_06440 [Candidatus Dormibacteraeota bacterium]|nr:hypothetical protein [Candidatus Dormibacteraeota bacterium]
MGRVLFVRLTNPGRASGSEWTHAVAGFAASRTWRCQPLWLATDNSPGLFEMEYLRHLRLEAGEPIFGAGFVRLAGDETDALAVCFGLLQLTRTLGGRAVVTDPDNPIRKQRELAVVEGEVSGPRSIDEVMVAGPIFKRLPGGTITFYPPRYRGVTLPGPASSPGWWSFAIHGMQDQALGFLEAEAEAMRIYRSLRAIG